MILGFLGKGGSGKSSVATQMALFSYAQGNTVLAIDADHNMDHAHNLTGGEVPSMRYLSDSLSDIQTFIKLSGTSKYQDTFLQDVAARFRLSPRDEVTAKYTAILKDNFYVMVAGPQTDTVLYGQACSHSLTTALKVYLPLLMLGENEMVIVDEKAGADGVTTGIVTGIDVGAIVCEPTLHSIKTAKQIAQLMDFYQTPYVFVGNKISATEDKELIKKGLGISPIVYLVQSNDMKWRPQDFVLAWENELATIMTTTRKLNKNNRIARTKLKFTRNREFAQH